ncbi:MAG: putative ABC transporter ATP-binding protein [Microgenomates bacterium OLB23]|nr:MAG: putative ABC transporter ATP-binding protein [Microgenomates bacterium OLB23]
MRKNDLAPFSWNDFFKAVLFLLGKRKKTYLLLTFVLILVLTFGALPPYIIGKTIDFLSSYTQGDSLEPFFVLVIFGTITSAVASYFRLQIKQSLGDILSDMSYDIRVQGFEKLMSLSLAWHDKQLTGNKYQRLQKGIGDLWAISYFFGNTVYPTVIGVAYTIILLIFVRPLYVPLVLLYGIGFCLILWYFYNRLQNLNEQLNQAMEDASGVHVEGLGNILTLKSSGAQKKFGSHIALREKIKKQYEYEIRRVSILQWQVYQIYNAVVLGVFLIYSGIDVARGILSAGTIVIINSYLVQITNRTSDILSNYEKILESKSGIGRMMNIFWAKDVSVSRGTQKFPPQWKKLILDQATFAYSHDTTKTALDNVSITVTRHQKSWHSRKNRQWQINLK